MLCHDRAVASSDATNMQATIDRSNGRLGHAGAERTQVVDDWQQTRVVNSPFSWAFMRRWCDPESRHQRHSMVLVDMKNDPGVSIVRPLHVLNYDDAPHGHCETKFENVVVPKSTSFSDRQGFEIAQSRLGPGRIHHCMRQIRAADRSVGAVCRQVASRHAFGNHFPSRARSAPTWPKQL